MPVGEFFIAIFCHLTYLRQNRAVILVCQITFSFTEPFDLTNTARSVYDWNMFAKIKAEFKRVNVICFVESSQLSLLHVP